MMKSSFFYGGLLFLTFFTLTSLSAQFGIKGGIAASDIAFKKYGQSPYLGYENNSLIHEKPLLSYQLGLFTQLNFRKKWHLQPELLFAAKGINYSKDFLYDDITYKINISYLEVPVLLNYSLSNRDKGRTALYIGPYVAWKLRAMRNTEVEGIREKEKVPNINSGDLGGIAGVAVNRKLLSGQIVFDFRLSFSLINMMDPIEGHVPEHNKTPEEYARNAGIIFSVGYLFDRFPLNKNEP